MARWYVVAHRPGSGRTPLRRDVAQTVGPGGPVGGCHAGAYVPVGTVTLADADSCYFDLRLRFPTSGSVRLAYTYPPGLGGVTVYSRTVSITER